MRKPRPKEPSLSSEEPDVPATVLGELESAFSTSEPAPGALTAAVPAESDQPSSEPVAPADRATIVIGGDDSLPDAVYLDNDEPLGPNRALGVSSEQSSRGTIVIGDELDSSGAFDAVDVPTRSMDPRVRARRIAVKRERGRKRLVWVAAILFVVLLAVAVLAVFASSIFAVEVVDVQGATNTQHFEPAQLQAVIDGVVGEPVLLVDKLALERQLEAISWVERAFVTTDFPNSVLFDIRERMPLATFQGSDGRYRVIDRDGRVLSVVDGRPVDYMELFGPAPDAEPGALSGTPFAQAAQMVGALPAEIRDITERAWVDATTGDLGLVLTGEIEVRIGSFSGLDAKLARLLQQVRNGLDEVVRIDVSTDEVSVAKG